MHRHMTRAATVAVLVTTLATVPAGAALAAAPGTDDDRRLLQQGADDLTALSVTGVQALIRDGHRVAEARSGVADITTNRPMPRDGYFRMGSNSKTFAAVIVLQLVGEGRLRLDDPVERWLPGLITGNGNDGSKITVRQVLQHQSGLPEYTAHVPLFDSPEAFEAHRFDHYDDEELVRLAMSDPPVFAPGAGWSYSNTNYIVAGMIIESVTGRPWQTQLERRILRPAGMSETFYPGDDPDLPQPHAQAYEIFDDSTELVDTTRWNTTVAGAAGGLVTTPSDLARFWQALQSGRLLRPAEFAAMHRTVPIDDEADGPGYGLGIFFTPTDCGGYWGHDGAVPGMYTLDGVTADGHRAVVVSLSSAPREVENAPALGERAGKLLTDALC